MDDRSGTLFDALGGADGVRRLAEAWHRRATVDEVVGHAFAHGYRADHTDRLVAYLTEALGGPDDYTARYGGESDVVRVHSGNGPHHEMDRRAIDRFDDALGDVGLGAESPLFRALHDYFAWATTTTMAAYERSADDVPDGLEIPHWSWNGRVDPADGV